MIHIALFEIVHVFLARIVIRKNFFESISKVLDHEESENQGPDIIQQILEGQNHLYL